MHGDHVGVIDPSQQLGLARQRVAPAHAQLPAKKIEVLRELTLELERLDLLEVGRVELALPVRVRRLEHDRPLHPRVPGVEHDRVATAPDLADVHETLEI